MNTKYLLFCAFLIGAIAASNSTNVVTTTPCADTTTTTTKRTTTTTTTTPKPSDPSWKKGVDEHCKKCSAALKFYVGPTYREAKTLLNSLLCLVPKLVTSTKSASLIISSKSVAMLETISLMSEVGTSPTGILNGFNDVLHTVAGEYKKIILSLKQYIGVIGVPTVIDAIYDLECSLYTIMADYRNAALLNLGDEDIDYKPVLKSIQNLTNAVARITDSALQNCKNEKDVRDALYILALVLDHLLIIAHATNVSIAADLKAKCGVISEPLLECLKAIDPLVKGITKALTAVVENVIESVISVLKAIVDLAKSLNAVLKSVFGLVQDVTKTVSGTLSGLTNILKIGR